MSAEAALKNTYLTLLSGHKMPQIGLGTWKSKPGQVKDAVIAAIDAGYRHIDCAHAYGNENEVGEALKIKMADGTVKREDLFIVSKLWAPFNKAENVGEGIKRTVKSLGLDYLDLYLIHSPMASPWNEGGELMKGEDGKFLMVDVPPTDTWQGMEKEVAKTGLAKSIGVSNFNIKQLEELLKIKTVPICVNQIEIHPGLDQSELIGFCKSKGIQVTAYSPLGSPDRSFATAKDLNLRESPVVKEVADAKGCTPVQVLLAYHICQENIVIPKSVTPSRIQDNFKAYDVKLTAADIEKLNTMQCNFRACPWPMFFGHPNFPFPDVGIAYK